MGAALLIKGIAAFLRAQARGVGVVAKSYGVLLGIAAGAAAAAPGDPAAATRAGHRLRDRAAVVAACCRCSSPDVLQRAAPLTLFNWRYGHLLNFNGLTRSVLLAWPLAAAALAVRARRAAGLGPRRRRERAGPDGRDPL